MRLPSCPNQKSCPNDKPCRTLHSRVCFYFKESSGENVFVQSKKCILFPIIYFLKLRVAYQTQSKYINNYKIKHIFAEIHWIGKIQISAIKFHQNVENAKLNVLSHTDEYLHLRVTTAIDHFLECDLTPLHRGG